MVRKRNAAGVESGSAQSNGSRSSGFCLCRGTLCWISVLFLVAAAWAGFLFLVLHTPHRRAHPLIQADSFNAEGARQMWSEDVANVDQTLAALRHSFEGQAARMKSLSDAVASASRPRAPDVTAPVMGEDRRPPLLAVGRQTREQSPSLPGVKEEGQKGCTFQDNLDYASLGGEDIVQNVSPEDCCRICMDRNKQRPGSCAVGVLSSRLDTPPSACWLKEKVGFPIRKPGVKACWPLGQQLPDSPEEAARKAEKAQQEARSLTASAASLPGAKPDVATLRTRAEAIRNAMRHAWDNYKKLAWGADELRPLAGRPAERAFRHAVTMVDSLDTLWIMGLREEFQEAKAWLVHSLPARIQSISKSASIFETTIRSLGGLLSAYDLSKDTAFLDLAKLFGQRILSSVRHDGVTPYTFGGGVGGMGCPSLAESGTIQIEMTYLSRATGDPSFAERVDKFYDTVRNKPSHDGLYPNCWSSARGKISFGADGDSFYEYLIKVWLLKGHGRVQLPGTSVPAAVSPNGKSFDFLWDMFDRAANGFEKHLVRKGADGLAYIGNLFWQGGGAGGSRYEEEMEHLTCFAAGWLGLGAHAADARAHAARERRMKLAEDIALTCWHMYDQQPTGIGPERVKRMKMDLSATDTREYILRPEAVEAWFYMHQLSGDPQYREWGWKTFMAFEQWLKVPHGYASLKDVRRTDKKYIDRMESFFLAETLKYLFLLEDPDNKITLDKYVFNTEAHPLKYN